MHLPPPNVPIQEPLASHSPTPVPSTPAGVEQDQKILDHVHDVILQQLGGDKFHAPPATPNKVSMLDEVALSVGDNDPGEFDVTFLCFVRMFIC